MWKNPQSGLGLKAHVLRILRERTQPALTTLLRSRQPIVWILALVVGVAAGYAILAFRWAIGSVQWLWLGNRFENVVASLASDRPGWIVMLALIIGGVVVGLILQWLSPIRRAEGIADVIQARAIGNADLSLKSGIVSIVVSAISLGAGASAGREGPAVHLGSLISAKLGRLVELPPGARRNLLACGAAAAVSASFNAPIAGVLFAHEVILAHYALSAFVPTVLSAVVATLITRIYLGDFPAFIIPGYEITSFLEFPAFAILGVVCGVVAAIFLLSIMTAEWVARRIDIPFWTRPAAGGLLVGLIALFFPEVLGVGYEATNLALREKYTLVTLLLLLAAKIAATSITVASRFGGGVFSPALYLGAMAGGAFGLIAGPVFPELASSYGVYAIIGMGAVTGAVLGAPLSTAVIVFELTGGYEMTIALLLAVSIASMITQTLIGDSFLTWQLSTRGLSLADGPHKRIMQVWRVRDFMTGFSEEERANPPEVFADRPHLTSLDTMETALRVFAQGNYTRIAVFDPADPQKHIGWADYTATLNAYNRALIEANVEEHR